jgi:hypothetical protein
MPKVTPKIELLIDLSNPVEETKGCIAAIVNAHLGKELEILNQVDLWLGQEITNLEKKLATKKPEPASQKE